MIYNKEYLFSLIENKVEESLNLDYKSAMALAKQPNKTAEISKDVSALANSDGGIIIYGIKEDSEQRYLPKEIDPINRRDFSKEWLEQIISDKIRPRIDNFKIHPISITDEEVIYIVEVDKSNTAHQAEDKRYYKRYNFQSVPMYDYEIRDILNRQKHPKLELTHKFSNNYKTLTIFARNVGSVYAKYVNVRLRLPKTIVVSRQGCRIINDNTAEFFVANTVRELVDTYSQIAKYWPSRYEPILPQTSFKLIEIELHNFPFDAKNTIEWEIFCDNANPKIGSFRLYDLLQNNSQ